MVRKRAGRDRGTATVEFVDEPRPAEPPSKDKRHALLQPALVTLGLPLALAARSWPAVVIAIALPVIAAYLTRQPFQENWRGVSLTAAVVILLGVASVVALNPDALGDADFCDAKGAPIGACLMVDAGGQDDWANEADTSPGALVLVKGQIKAYDVQSNNTIVMVPPSAEFTWVDESLRVAYSTTNGQWVSDGGSLIKPGLNFGSYAPNGNAFFNFAIRISEAETFRCGVTRVVIPLRVESTSGNTTSDALVNVKRQC